VPNGFSIVVSNWSADKDSPGWPGHGYSCVIDRDGRVLSMAKSQKGSEIVYADLLFQTTQDVLPREP
jgi:predicted amidohydrolase